jgi:hypothetical protein
MIREYVLCNKKGQTFNCEGHFCYDSDKMVIFSGRDRDHVKKGNGEFWEYLDIILTRRES